MNFMLSTGITVPSQPHIATRGNADSSLGSACAFASSRKLRHSQKMLTHLDEWLRRVDLTLHCQIQLILALCSFVFPSCSHCQLERCANWCFRLQKHIVLDVALDPNELDAWCPDPSQDASDINDLSKDTDMDKTMSEHPDRPEKVSSTRQLDRSCDSSHDYAFFALKRVQRCAKS